MKHLVHSLAVIILIFAALLVQYGCKENVLINSKLSPSANAINIASVTLPVITHTYYSDSTITSTNIGGIAMYMAVGTITDPYFGVMTGSTYFQVLPPLFSPLIFSGDTLDSAVLVLPYSGYTYGDTLNTNASQTYQVFYMTDTLGDPVNENYYSNSTKSIDASFPLSDPTTVNLYHLRDSVGLYPNVLDANYPGLRIKLKMPILLNRLNAAINNINPNSTTLPQDFENMFRGVCVKVADTRTSNTTIPYFQLDGTTPYSTAGILVYYHSPGVDSEQFSNFSFNTQFCAHFNNITRSYAHYQINNLLHSTEANDKVIALENDPGPSIDVVIPGIKSLINTGIINKAELQFTLLPANNPATLSPPERLYPTGIASATYPLNTGLGVAYNIADRYPVYSTTPLVVIDGYLHNLPATPTLQTFTVNIPREVMYSIASNNDVIHLKITGTQDFYGAFHMVAGGGAYAPAGSPDTVYNAKLIVTYSKTKN